MKYKVKKESVDVYAFEKALNYCNNLIGYNIEPKDTDKISNNWYLWQDRRSNYHLVFRDYCTKKVRHLVLDPYTGEKDYTIEINNAGARTYKKIKKYTQRYNEDINFKDNDKYLNYTWIPFEYMDTSHVFKKVIAYEYDSNSNYLAQFKKPLPYGDIIRENDYIKQDEIGFNIIYNGKGKKAIEAVFKGHADIIFKAKIYQGLTDFANDMYAKRKSMEDGIEKDKFKKLICSAHGNLKYHNIFMAVAIIGYSKQELLSYCDGVHVYMHTVDSIICDRPIDNIPIGTDLGQYKLKHIKEEFMYQSHGIKVWEDGDCSHKGLKKSRIGIYTPKYFVNTNGELFKYE